MTGVCPSSTPCWCVNSPQLTFPRAVFHFKHPPAKQSHPQRTNCGIDRKAGYASEMRKAIVELLQLSAVYQCSHAETRSVSPSQIICNRHYAAGGCKQCVLASTGILVLISFEASAVVCSFTRFNLLSANQINQRLRYAVTFRCLTSRGIFQGDRRPVDGSPPLSL